MNFSWLLAIVGVLMLPSLVESSEVDYEKNAKTYVDGKQKMNAEDRITIAKTALSERLDIPEREIEVLSSSSVTWRSGALGCPESGTVYTQALVPGMVIVLAAKDKVYRYHSDLDGLPFYCPSHRVESKKINPDDL